MSSFDPSCANTPLTCGYCTVGQGGASVRYAVISGVQGNVVALNAVLEEIGRQTGIERILCAGDVVGLGPHPNEVIDLLRDLHVDVVKGNYDDAVAFNRISSGVDFPDGN